MYHDNVRLPVFWLRYDSMDMLLSDSSQTMLPTRFGETFYRRVFPNGTEEFFWTMVHDPNRFIDLDREGITCPR